MIILRCIVLPLAIVYGLVLAVRNKLFDWKILSSTQFDFPIISVGNLSMGGTGKTPQIEYLIRLLQAEFELATLSRGYGRKTTGFLLANDKSLATDIGDEPLQLAQKYPSVHVAVDEKRVRGVQLLRKRIPSIQAILLDDAFQHRSIKPGLSILLTDFNALYTDDFIVPTGRLREFTAGAKRANIIIVTKCPNLPFNIERQEIITRLKPLAHQHVYFSSIRYGEFAPLSEKQHTILSKKQCFDDNYTILLLSGIANIEPLQHYLAHKAQHVKTMTFGDHHNFTAKELKVVEAEFTAIPSAKKIIVTTEKDAMRLKTSNLSNSLNQLPVFYIPIEVRFSNDDKQLLNAQILNYVRKN
jgi:tetraacyldisaccharide 4'-kinase